MTVHSSDSVGEARAVLTSAAGPYTRGKDLLSVYSRGAEAAAAALLAGEIYGVSVPEASGAELLAAAAVPGVGFLTPEDPHWQP